MKFKREYFYKVFVYRIIQLELLTLNGCYSKLDEESRRSTKAQKTFPYVKRGGFQCQTDKYSV